MASTRAKAAITIIDTMSSRYVWHPETGLIQVHNAAVQVDSTSLPSLVENPATNEEDNQTRQSSNSMPHENSNSFAIDSNGVSHPGTGTGTPEPPGSEELDL